MDITTGAVDAIYPARAAKMPIPAPKWLATMPNDASITQAVGSGPYQLVEFVKGDHFLLKANANYWGPNKPKIAEIKIVFRNEVAVRTSMIQAGEAQLATLLTPEALKQLPATVVEQTGEAVGIRINPEHPVLKDLRVRQAINMAFDRKSMIDALYGEVAEPLNGQLVRKTSVGWNPNLKDYPVRSGQSQAARPGGRGGRPDPRADQPERHLSAGRRGDRAVRESGQPDRAEDHRAVAGGGPVADRQCAGQAG